MSKIKKLKEKIKAQEAAADKISYSSCGGELDVSVIYFRKDIKKMKKKLKALQNSKKTEKPKKDKEPSICNSGYSSCGGYSSCDG